MVLTQQLKEAKDGLHDDDNKAHFSVILVLVPRVGLAVCYVEVVLRVRFTPIRVEGLLGSGRGF